MVGAQNTCNGQETEAQRKRGLAQGVTARKWLSQAWNSELSTPFVKGPIHLFLVRQTFIQSFSRQNNGPSKMSTS